MSELQRQVVGLLDFALMIAGISVVMKGLAWIGDRITARAYAPLARAVGDQVDLKGPWIVMTLRGLGRPVLPDGLFGQGPLQLTLETNDLALAVRLEGRGVYEAVAAVAMPSTYYAPVDYDPWARTLLLVDDVSQQGLPKPETLVKHAELTVWLAEPNVGVSPPI
jgi:hypothetical protein